MTDQNLENIRNSEEYKELVSSRSAIIWPLSYLMLFVYYFYILVIAFKPELFAIKIGDGHTTWGIVIGLGVILFTFLLTGIYIHKANSKLDALIEKLHAKYGG